MLNGPVSDKYKVIYSFNNDPRKIFEGKTNTWIEKSIKKIGNDLLNQRI